MQIEIERLKETIQNSKSLREVAVKMGLSSHHVVKKFAKENNIDISKFERRSRHNHLIGKTFHMLKLLSIEFLKSKSGNKEKTRTYANCVCECGKNKRIRLDELKSNRVLSCGCHSHNRWNMITSQNPAFTGCGELRSCLVSQYKDNAKRRGIPFDLSVKYLWEIFEKQERKCDLTGLPIWFGRVHYHNETSASLDRIDSNQGYIEGNVRWVLKDINMIKGAYNNEYFVRLCNLVANAHPREVENLGESGRRRHEKSPFEKVQNVNSN